MKKLTYSQKNIKPEINSKVLRPTSAMFVYDYAFTIVELLVVIVVIGIIAAVSIVSYIGVAEKAKIASIQSDLVNSSKQLKIFNIDNGYYPVSISTDCMLSPTTTTNICLKASPGNSFTTRPYLRPTEQSFALTIVNGNLRYHITENSMPTAGIFIDPDFMAIGTQIWARSNLNVGTKINDVIAQTDNSIIEKYCYYDNNSNCAAYGALYQWNEAMQYVTSERARGICPVGSHIPSDNDWKILEMELGMTQLQADTTGWRGTDQGTKLLQGGSTGLNIPLGGFRNNTSTYDASSFAYLWTSSEFDSTYAWARMLANGNATILRNQYQDKSIFGFSIRCVGD